MQDSAHVFDALMNMSHNIVSGSHNSKIATTKLEMERRRIVSALLTSSSRYNAYTITTLPATKRSELSIKGYH